VPVPLDFAVGIALLAITEYLLLFAILFFVWRFLKIIIHLAML